MAAYSHSYPLTLIIFSLIFVLGHISSEASSESSSSFGSEFQPLLPSEIEALGLEINSDDEILQEESLSLIPSNHIIDGDEFDDIHDDNVDSHLADNDNQDQLHNHTTPDLLIPFDESDVIVLAAANFSDFIAQNYFSMVMFYAPWCGHCKALGPHYAAAASELKKFDPGNRNVSLAKVDSTQNPDLAIQFDVEEYPTIFFFVDGMPKLYSHNLTRDAIVTWVKKMMAPAVVDVVSTDDAWTILETGNTVVVAFFENSEGNEVQEFESVAQYEDDVLFYKTEKEDVAEVFGIKKGIKAPALVVVKNVPEKVVVYDGIFRKDALLNFIKTNKLPLVSTFSKDTAIEIFESPIKQQILFFATPEVFQQVLPIYEEVAMGFKGKILFVHIDSSKEDVGKPIAASFGIDVGKPKILALTVSEEDPKKFLFDDEITVEKLKDFATKFLDGELKVFYKSEPIPEINVEDVKIVVGNSFDEIVLNESKDVLLEVYAPWCGYCQAFEPIYKKLAKALKDVHSLVIAKIDGTTNEHAKLKVDEYPTLLFFPAKSKRYDPMVFEGEKSIKTLYQYLKHNAGVAFTLAKEEKLDEQTNTLKTSYEDSTYQMKEEL